MNFCYKTSSLLVNKFEYSNMNQEFKHSQHLYIHIHTPTYVLQF